MNRNPGSQVFVAQWTLSEHVGWQIRACWSHSGWRPRVGRTSGGHAFDWLGIHLSLRRW